MNPITLLNAIVGSYAEGERKKMFGADYKEKQALQRAQAEKTLRSIPLDEQSAATEAEIAQHQIKDYERKAREAALDTRAEVEGARLEQSDQGPQDPNAPPVAEDDLIARSRAARAAQDRALKIAGAKRDITSSEERSPNFVPDLTPGARKELGLGDEPTNLASLSVAEKAADARRQLERDRSVAGIRASAFRTDVSQDQLSSIADRVAAGEISVDTARGLVGGVRGGHGVGLMDAVGDRRVIPAAIRKDLVGIQTTRNIVDQMEQLVNQVSAAKDPTERVQATLLLQQFGQTTGTLLSRGFGERGVVTDKDVARATGLVPGWKAANFAPEYAKREIALLRQVLDRNEQGVRQGYFAEQGSSGGGVGSAPPGTGGAWEDLGGGVRRRRVN